MQIKSKNCVILLFLSVVLTVSLAQPSSLICPSTVSSSTAITTRSDKFNGYTNTDVDAVVSGPVSNSLYYLYYVYTSDLTVVRKINSDDTLNWMAAFTMKPAMKSLSVDTNELNVYIASADSSTVVSKMSSSDGSLLLARAQ